MTSSRPYLIRAVYEWITDNSLTPQIVVNAELAIWVVAAFPLVLLTTRIFHHLGFLRGGVGIQFEILDDSHPPWIKFAL